MTKNLILIKNLIYEIRGFKVMLDSDLANLYNVETKALNRAVKRNIERFPEDFMFQLTKEEWEFLRCQNGTSNENEEKRGGRKYLPYVFTEQGISMLSGVLHSKEAIAVNVQIMRIFVQLRQYALAQTSNVEELKKMLLLHIENTDNKFKNQNKTIQQIINALNNLIEKPKENKRIEF